ncbi:hypothetical protein VDG1235_4746 [Verrucomicrobiia bacterium DG1235]|nr:hypothetical protein VDG1235_4746 [Verrucomicrobiae bacterium DG1235]
MVVGMTEAEVIAILGEPMKVEEVYHDTASAQIWHYEKDVVLSSTIESDGEQERSYYDQKTGVLVTVREPIFRNESIRGKIIAELLFAEGKLVAMKEKEGAREYDVNHGQR